MGPGGAIGPWTVAGAGVVLVSTFGNPLAIDGAQSVELNLFQGGSVAQTVPTVVGQAYELSWLMAGQLNSGPVVKTLDLYLNDVNVGTFVWNINSAGSLWETRSTTFVATSETTNVRFRGTVEVDGGAYIDVVNLVAVAPEPGAVGTFGGMGTALLLLRRRR